MILGALLLWIITIWGSIEAYRQRSWLYFGFFCCFLGSITAMGTIYLVVLSPQA